MSSPSRSPVEKQTTAASQADQAQALNLENKQQGTLNQFEGPVTSSPFYKELLTAGTDSTANAYQNAASNQKKNANATGFNYAQPAAAGEEDQLAGQEAAQLSALPREAAMEATGPALTAAGQTGATGTAVGGQGLGYMTGGTVPLENQYQQDQSSFWNNLLAIPGQVAGAGATAYAGR